MVCLVFQAVSSHVQNSKFACKEVEATCHLALRLQRSEAALRARVYRAPKDHIPIKILQTTVSGIGL